MIKKIIINSGLLKATEISFDKNTIITSDENSKGKTTLLRFILYGMGYKIPSTKNVDMNEYIISLFIENNNGELILTRHNNKVTIKYSDDVEKSFDLKEDNYRLLVQSQIFNTDNYSLLKNILMTMYIDQDKGWTLLNRGKVVGNNRFDISDFVASLSGVDIMVINKEIEEINKEIEKYKALSQMAILKSEFSKKYNNKIKNTKGLDERNKLLLIKNELVNEREIINKKISELERVKEQNDALVNHIINYRLLIKHGESDPFVLSKENIVYFDVNQNILNYEISREKFHLTKVNKEIIQINSKIKPYEQLVDAEDVASKIINSIIISDIDSQNIEDILESLKDKRKDLNERKRSKAKYYNKYVDEIANLIIKFTKQLGVYEDLIRKERDFLFTKNLKQYSGAILHKIVFSYRLAYNIVASNVIGMKLPFIVDSPGAAEMTIESIEAIMSLAKEYLCDNQVIVSTVYKEVIDIFDDSDTKNIHLKDMLLNNEIY